MLVIERTDGWLQIHACRFHGCPLLGDSSERFSEQVLSCSSAILPAWRLDCFSSEPCKSRHLSLTDPLGGPFTFSVLPSKIPSLCSCFSVCFSCFLRWPSERCFGVTLVDGGRFIMNHNVPKHPLRVRPGSLVGLLLNSVVPTCLSRKAAREPVIL